MSIPKAQGFNQRRPVITAICVSLLCVAVTSACSSQTPPTESPLSSTRVAPFDGSRFSNRQPMNKGLTDLLGLAWQSVTQATPWPDNRPVNTQTLAVAPEGIHVTFINHSTFLLQIDGVTVLTDPIYSERASPVSWAGPKRAHDPGIVLEDLPPIDCLLVSHDHYDHLDFPTLETLATRSPGTTDVITGLGNDSLIQRAGFDRVAAVDWGDTVTCHGLPITFVEVRHRSGRGLLDQMKTLWGGFVIETSRGPIFFGGDTGYGPHFSETAELFGPFALALIPIGAYEPRWFMKDVHLNPHEAVLAHQDLQSAQSVGIHYGTFQLTLEGIDTPIEDLDRAMAAANLPRSEFWTLAIGETRSLNAATQKPQPE